MEEKKYPKYEEKENAGMCSEPPVGNSATESGRFNTIEDKAEMIADDFDPGIGPYTMEELDARIDEAEAFIAQAENGDLSNWVSEEHSRANLYNKYPWLR